MWNIALLSVVVIAYYQCYAAEKNVLSDQELFEVADTLLKRLQMNVEETINTTIPILQLLPYDIVYAANAIAISARRDVQEQISEIQADVYDLRDEAEQLGTINMTNLENCIESFQWELTSLQVVVTWQIENCLNVTCTQGIDFIQLSIADIKTSQNIVDGLALDVDQCRITSDEACIIEVIEAISIAIVDLPARIKEDGVKARLMVDALEKTLKGCAADRIGLVSELGGNVVKNIRNCAKMSVIS